MEDYEVTMSRCYEFIYNATNFEECGAEMNVEDLPRCVLWLLPFPKSMLRIKVDAVDELQV